MDVLNYYPYTNWPRQTMYPYSFTPRNNQPGFIKYAEREISYMPEQFTNYPRIPEYGYNGYNRFPPENMNVWHPPRTVWQQPQFPTSPMVYLQPSDDVYRVPSVNFNGFYGRSQIISLGLKNLTKDDVSFSNTDVTETDGIPDTLCSIMRMLSRSPFRNSESEINRAQMTRDPLSNVSPLQALWQTVPANSSFHLSEDAKKIKSDSECAIKVDEIESSICFSGQDQTESPYESFMTTVTFASSTEMGTPLSDEYSIIHKQGDSAISAEAFAQGDREKHNKIHPKHIQEITLDILKMFAHHEGEDFFDKWTPENISQLGSDTGINIRYLMHVLNDSDEINRTLTKRQKRDLATMIDAQVARFKLVGTSWAATCEEIISGLNSRATLLENLMPCLMKEIDY